jgi:hypothetical protein
MKTVSLFAPFVLVLIGVTDQAVDVPSMVEQIDCADGKKRRRLDAYLATYDERYLRLKPGAEPIRFTLGPLRQRTVNRLVEDPENPTGDELWQIVAASLLDVRDPRGRIKLTDEDRSNADADGRRSLTDDAMERLAQALGISAIREIGSALVRRSSLPEWAAAPFVSAGGSEASSSTTA